MTDKQILAKVMCLCRENIKVFGKSFAPKYPSGAPMPDAKAEGYGVATFAKEILLEIRKLRKKAKAKHRYSMHEIEDYVGHNADACFHCGNLPDALRLQDGRLVVLKCCWLYVEGDSLYDVTLRWNRYQRAENFALQIPSKVAERAEKPSEITDEQMQHLTDKLAIAMQIPREFLPDFTKEESNDGGETKEG